MAEFDEKLNHILSDPNAMAQIMELAKSLGGSSAPTQTPAAPDLPPTPPAPPPILPDGQEGATSIPSIDPKLLGRLLPLVRELGGPQDTNARQLLYALRPYLKAERQEKVERALQLARLFHLGKKFLSEWEG